MAYQLVEKVSQRGRFLGFPAGLLEPSSEALI
jgi:hypothetical protein